MKVCLVSTYPPLKDGISHYVHFLYGEMPSKDVEIAVLANGRPRHQHEKRILVKGVWGKTIGLIDTARIIHAVLREKADIVHLQFHAGLYGHSRNLFLAPLSALLFRLLHRRFIVTFHTVRILNLSTRWEKFLIRTYIGTLALLSHQIVVQTDQMRELLANEYSMKPDKIVSIPYGIRNIQRIEGSVAKGKVGLADGFYIFIPSLLRPLSGVEHVLRAMPELVKKRPDIFLIVAVASPSFYGKGDKYLESIKEMVSPDIKHNVMFLQGFDSLDSKSSLWMNAADLLVYLHENYSNEESSLSVCDAVAYGKPVIISDAPKFRTVADILDSANLSRLIVPTSRLNPDDVKDTLVAAILRLQQDLPYHDLTEAYESLSRLRPWSEAARKMSDLYVNALASPSKKALGLDDRPY